MRWKGKIELESEIKRMRVRITKSNAYHLYCVSQCMRCFTYTRLDENLSSYKIEQWSSSVVTTFPIFFSFFAYFICRVYSSSYFQFYFFFRWYLVVIYAKILKFFFVWMCDFWWCCCWNCHSSSLQHFNLLKCYGGISTTRAQHTHIYRYKVSIEMSDKCEFKNMPNNTVIHAILRRSTKQHYTNTRWFKTIKYF